MKRLNKIIIIVLVLLMKLNITHAQNYPVQITTLLSPPFSGYLPDYTSLGNENLKLIVLFNDFTKPSYNVKLKFKLSGQNINIESKNFYYEGPFTIIPGVPLEISGADLAGLLNSNNLNFSGISKQQYETGKVLPEGLYTLCFTAYDYNNPTEIKVSNESCFSGWMMLNDPPYLNFPMCGNPVTVTNPQNVTFQWTSMNLISPNSANNTSYEFSLYEIIPKGANPNNILQSLPPIYQTTTNITTLNYGLTEPVLNVGMDYIWRVKAIDLTGRDLFKNNGYSQLCTFTYGNMSEFIDSSSMALTLQGVPLNYRLGKCFWNPLSIYKNYTIYYRKQNGINWFTNTGITETYNLISNLEANSTYEAYVKGTLLDDNSGPASNTVIITTPQKADFVCGQLPAPPPVQAKPLLVAATNQIWEVGQFDMIVTSLNNFASTTGQYSGYGNVAVPFLGNYKFNVKFTNVTVNEEFQIIAGKVDVITQGIANWTHAIDVLKAEENATYINGTITGFTITGNQYCYTTGTNSTPVCDTLPAHGNVFIVRDEEGNQYTVQLNPPPPKVTGPTNYLHYSADSLAASDSVMVTFNSSATQNFGFDKKEYAAFIKNYEVIKLKNGKNYFVPNKSVGENQTDEVIAQVQIVNFNSSLLNFKTNNGTLLNKSSNGLNSYKLTGIPENQNCVYAWYNNKKIGKLNITGLKAITKKVVLVPVNNASATLTNAMLNDIFKQANVSWSVTTAPNFTFDLVDGKMDSPVSTMFDKYSDEMKLLRNSYREKDTTYDKEALYVFVIPQFTDGNQVGYMARGKALGFISSAADVKNIAHELGHGAFAYKHPFPSVEKGTTNNLMDYGSGSMLILEQWQKAQKKPENFTWFDDEDDGSIFGSDRSAETAFTILTRIKLAYKKGTSLAVPEGSKKCNTGAICRELIGKATNCFVGGVQYDFIEVYIDPYKFPRTASPRNGILIDTYDPGHGGAIKSELVVDNHQIMIRVPQGRINNMLLYLRDTFMYKNLMVFCNGYRPIVNFNDGQLVNSSMEYANTNNACENGDCRGYWKGIDQQFMNRVGDKYAVYFDGHHSVGTSNHNSVANYMAGNLLSDYIRSTASLNTELVNTTKLNRGANFLHTNPNVGGFNERAVSGEEGARNLIARINNGSVIFNKATDVIDVVAHSMGYAYSVGLIRELKKNGFKFGRYYILAPENACSGGVDLNWFEEAWQYGSNLGEQDEDFPWLQDGVAPQCAVQGMNTIIAPTIGGRVFIPDVDTKSYLGSHSVSNYGWIFKIIKDDPKGGYVKARN